MLCDWYRSVPPENTYGFLSSGCIERGQWHELSSSKNVVLWVIIIAIHFKSIRPEMFC